MSEYGNLRIFDRLIVVENGPLSNIDTVPNTVSIEMASGNQARVQFVITSEVAAELAKQLRPYTQR